ncbi:MAG: hypothetical protein WCP69_15275 [Bacteroidota bacterium]
MIAGITGHRELKNIGWIKTMISEVLSEMKITYGYSCLAIGADELFAELLIQNNINYTVVIPCTDYETTFEKTTLGNFLLLKGKASELIELKNNQPSEKAFNEAGKIIVDNSDILIAVWDGEEAKGLGGTGDIVEYAKSKNKKIIHLNPINKTKKLINYG